MTLYQNVSGLPQLVQQFQPVDTPDGVCAVPYPPIIVQPGDTVDLPAPIDGNNFQEVQ